MSPGGLPQGDSSGKVCWQEIYRILMHSDPHWRPWEIRRMTLPEIALALDNDLEKKRAPIGSQAIGHEAVVAHARWIRTLTPKQRLQLARGEQPEERVNAE